MKFQGLKGNEQNHYFQTKIELEFNNRFNPNIFMSLCYTLMDKVNQIIEL